jgi:hypothetical protein
MNDTSQMGITIAGVAVVSAIAAVVFNKLNPEPRLSRYSPDNYYESEEDLPRRQSFDALPPRTPFAPSRQSFDTLPPRTQVAPSAPSRPSFEDDFQTSPNDDFDEPSRSFEEQPSFEEEFDIDSVDSSPSAPSVQSAPSAPSASSVQSAQSSPGAMVGGMRHTRCKHCHSRLRYTRRK